MWRALRAEIAYYHPWLLGAFGIALGITALLAGIFSSVGGDGPDPHAAAGIRGMFPMMAPLIVAYIAQGYRSDERRARLLLAGPLRPLQLAGVAVLVPVVLAVLGAVVSAVVMAIEARITGRLDFESVHFVAYVGGMLFMMAFVALLIQEAVAAFRQGRRAVSIAVWVILVLAVAAYASVTGGVVVYQGPNSWPLLHGGNAVLSLAAAIGTIVLFTRRTDFTK